MTVVFLCGMHGIPITYLANVLAVDWLLDRVDAVCKVGISWLFIIFTVNLCRF